MEKIQTDILIIGMGGAAQMAALNVFDANPALNILMVTKALKGKGGCSRMVQGGFNVVLNAAFGQPTIAVDTHVLRVANRTGLAPGRTPLEVEQALERVVPAAYRRHAHHWLILHGRYVCLARKPKCAECPVRDLCSYQAKTG